MAEFDPAGTCDSSNAQAYCVLHNDLDGTRFSSIAFYYESFSFESAEAQCNDLMKDTTTTAFCPL